MRSERGRNDGYPVLGFGESQQGMWRAGFEPNVGFEAREAAGCVKGSAKAVPIIQQEQRVRCKARNLDRALAAKRHRWMAGGKELSRFQCLAPELPVVQRDPIWEHLTKVYLATLQHCENFKTAPLRTIPEQACGLAAPMHKGVLLCTLSYAIGKLPNIQPNLN